MDDLARERTLAMKLAREAGALVLEYRQPNVEFEEKAGGEGPVTAADRHADSFIRQGLHKAFPQDGLLTEESEDDGAWRKKSRVWMVDPIDGTKEFIAGRDEFATMIGLCVDGQPVLGVMYQPVRDVLYVASRGHGAQVIRGQEVTSLQVATDVPSPVPIAVSRSHRSKRLQAILDGLGPVQEVQAGSVGLKLGMIAAQSVHAYLNATCRTSLWDTCAPYAVLAEAGGVLTDLYGQPLSYTGRVRHLYGLFGASEAAHHHLRKRLSHTAEKIAASLQELPEYPPNAFLPRGGT